MAFPVIQATATGRRTTTSTSHVITLPTNIQIGELLFVILAVDPGTTSQVDMNVSSGTDWYKWNWGHDGTALSSTIFWKYATGSDALTISTDASYTSAHFSARISGAKSFSADLNIGDTNDTFQTYGGHGRSYEILNLLVSINDGNLTNVTPPAGYTLLVTTSSPNTTSGASITSASKTSYGSRDPGENPGAWTFTAGDTPRNSWHFAFNETEWDNPSGIVGRQETKIGTATTSHTIRMPGNIQRGDCIEVFAGFDAATTVSINTGSSGNGWNIVSQASQATTGPTGFICYKIADGNDTLVLTSSVSTTSNAAASIWKGVAHITGALIGGAAGSASNPNLAETAASGNYNANTSTGFGGNWDQSMIVGVYYVLQSATLSGGWGDGGCRVGFTNSPSISHSAIPFLVYGANEINWNNWDAASPNAWVVGVATRWPTYARQIRLVARDSIFVTGQTGTSSRAFSNVSYVNKFNVGAPIGQAAVSFSVDGIRPGDMILVANAAGTAGRSPDLSISGYTQLGNVYSNGTSFDTQLWVGYKFMGKTVDTSIVFPYSGNVADASGLIYMVIRGVDPDNVVDGTVIVRSGTGSGRPSDYTKGTWRGVSALRTSPLLSSLGNNYVRIAAGAAATSVNLVEPSDSWATQTTISTGTNDVHALMSYVYPPQQQEGWSEISTTSVLTTGWTGGTTGAGDSWAEIIVPFNAWKRPIHGALLKVYNGTTWVPDDIRIYNGSSWSRSPVKHWNGSKWVTFTTNQFD